MREGPLRRAFSFLTVIKPWAPEYRPKRRSGVNPATDEGFPARSVRRGAEVQ